MSQTISHLACVNDLPSFAALNGLGFLVGNFIEIATLYSLDQKKFPIIAGFHFIQVLF